MIQIDGDSIARGVGASTLADMTPDTPDKDRIRGSVFTVNIRKALT